MKSVMDYKDPIKEYNKRLLKALEHNKHRKFDKDCPVCETEMEVYGTTNK